MTGSLTWQMLRDLKTSEFTQAGDKWHEVSARSGSDRAQVDRAMSAKLRETQESDSAEAALGRLRRLSRNFQYVQTECGLVRTALNGLMRRSDRPPEPVEAGAGGRGIAELHGSRGRLRQLSGRQGRRPDGEEAGGPGR